ncbi:Arsenic efflux pump protein [Minicystis rosea]|nr:Arsenic efflux pump protein [Minicystis rosea]
MASDESGAARPRAALDLGVLLGVAGTIAAVLAAVTAPPAARAAAAQSWPPFVLVTGLLLIGVVADHDGLFESAGARLARLGGGGVPLFIGLMSLVAVVTVVLNLDTAVAFLTPVVIHSARRRSLDDRPFVYGAVFMSNSASLLLPGSNLTNLLVLASSPVAGLAFGARMAAPWIASVVVTTIVVGVVYARGLAARGTPAGPAPPLRMGLGLAGTIGAAIALLAMSHPALLVLAIGVIAIAPHLVAGRIPMRRAIDAIGPTTLAGLFGAAVALGTLARTWTGPAAMLRAASGVTVAGAAALSTVLINNLPAAVLLSSWAPADRRALLIGLNLGPNLAITGALSAVLWLRVSRNAGARPSARTYSAIGLVLVPISIGAALLAAELAGAPPL